VFGGELQVGQNFRTIDGLGGIAEVIVSHKKGWSEVTASDPDHLINIPPICIFHGEILDIIE